MTVRRFVCHASQSMSGKLEQQQMNQERAKQARKNGTTRIYYLMLKRLNGRSLFGVHAERSAFIEELD
ncbi:hypothetical protein ACWI_02180 [Acetobacterium wieringae]|uniref:Uncharacterized protein n=1 Tax=Acetobacterium wieringae TaxID=52694 RepID=A0A1F2PLU1_9FIRM|nr:hypothetical protein ACWI_02180 [Acetobacterium wieringae]